MQMSYKNALSNVQSFISRGLVNVNLQVDLFVTVDGSFIVSIVSGAVGSYNYSLLCRGTSFEFNAEFLPRMYCMLRCILWSCDVNIISVCTNIDCLSGFECIDGICNGTICYSHFFYLVLFIYFRY